MALLEPIVAGRVTDVTPNGPQGPIHTLELGEIFTAARQGRDHRRELSRGEWPLRIERTGDFEWEERMFIK